MNTIDDYTALVTSEHRDKPNFLAALQALIGPVVGTNNQALALVDAFNLDEAEGEQLDAIGLWVGINRLVPTQLANVYFSWDSTAALGFESGYWQGPYDPTEGLTSVDDQTYRTMIRSKIAANIWDGTLQGMYDVWALVFGPRAIFIQDNQDMTLTVIYDSQKLTPVEIALLTGGYFRMKPSGVRMLFTSLSTAPLFAWDTNNLIEQGWNNTAVWSA